MSLPLGTSWEQTDPGRWLAVSLLIAPPHPTPDRAASWEIPLLAGQHALPPAAEGSPQASLASSRGNPLQVRASTAHGGDTGSLTTHNTPCRLGGAGGRAL